PAGAAAVGDLLGLQPPADGLRQQGDDQGRGQAGPRRGREDQQLGDLHRLLHAPVSLWIATGAAAAAAVALLFALGCYLALRRVRQAQLVLVGGGTSDLVDFAVSLQGRVDDLHRAVDEISAGLGRIDRRVDDTVSKTAIVRYDAYDNSGGHQSASVALLDSARTGVVLSAIQGRDYARIYVKEIDRGRASVALSPEELEAVERAMAS